ncbi:hypothetical protein [Streptomyces sp. NPDC006368]|uniref:hypothetical protein n=1 Tax=Streptomyces sp. NPDC006368 TaxID=3156760 RepID=UPI0033B1AD68
MNAGEERDRSREVIVFALIPRVFSAQAVAVPVHEGRDAEHLQSRRVRIGVPTLRRKGGYKGAGLPGGHVVQKRYSVAALGQGGKPGLQGGKQSGRHRGPAGAPSE